MNEKKKYYIAVEDGQILEDQGASAYELEILATPLEIDQLQRLFAKKEKENFELFIDPHLPNRWSEVQSGVVTYNQYLAQIYELVYQLGTPETKQHIEENQIIEKLQSDFQEYDFSEE